ncbi:MFS transporter [Amycolatopsis sp. DSM 110486]|uniref:MFS transporter n=1 Tax=Amycolatopsis sp. DSM 110486 TaxID=2865832 RepID=UPI001C6A212E|nr:MFS transporter [Amycolatopsis sp. DSM 110486]QYN21996.1 MFS transporter [Amycolatopsis sp. DSM 110486]
MSSLDVRETPGEPPPGISTKFAVLLAVVCGIAVANIYYAQPLLEEIGNDLGVGPAGLGFVSTVTQVGYFAGLIFIVPLGDLLNRRVLIPIGSVIAAVALVAVAVSPGPVTFFIASGVVGLATVVQQVIIAYSAVLSSPESRGRVLGIVTSGVVIGILLARTISGLLADAFGWRSVFVVSALLMLGVALVLGVKLPPELPNRPSVSYRKLITSIVTLTARERVFRVRSLITLFMFAGFGALWGSMALPLSADPWNLSTSTVGLFGLVGAAGAFGAARAGALADRGRAQWVTGITLVLFAVSWLPIAWLPHSLIPLLIGIVVIDFAGQAIHVTNQHLIVGINPNASSRLIGSNMAYYSVGFGGGAVAATTVYSAWGWTAVSILGAGFSLVALLIWGVDRISSARNAGPALAETTVS